MGVIAIHSDMAAVIRLVASRVAIRLVASQAATYPEVSRVVVMAVAEAVDKVRVN